jgi:uncharacterized protein (DUF2236 family)
MPWIRSVVDDMRAKAYERGLAALRAEVRDPRAGLYGPGTMAWEVSREAALFLGAGRAALLQLAHPYVGYAVGEHSVTRTDPLARFQNTFRRVFRMVFGDLDEAIGAAREVRRVHDRVQGTIGERAGPFERGHAYSAHDVGAQVWVLATLWDTSLIVFERVFRPLTDAERERYYAEGRRTAMLFGIEDAIPPTYADFRAYVQRMLEGEVLSVTRPAAEVGRSIMRPENVAGRIVRDDYGLMTAHLLPQPLAEAFGLDRGGARGERRVRALWKVASALFPRLPARLRFIPSYVEAVRRVEGRTDRDRVGEWMTALYLGRRRA